VRLFEPVNFKAGWFRRKATYLKY